MYKVQTTSTNFSKPTVMKLTTTLAALTTAALIGAAGFGIALRGKDITVNVTPTATTEVTQADIQLGVDTLKAAVQPEVTIEATQEDIDAGVAAIKALF